MYGEYTHIDDIYKNILTDAQQYINNDYTILPSGDDISVVHFQATDGVTWFRDTVAVAVRASELTKFKHDFLFDVRDKYIYKSS